MSVNDSEIAAPAAASVSVSNSHELYWAVQSLSQTGGGTITVQNAGTAYSLNAFKTGSDTGLIRVVAEDPDNPPVFTELRITESRNISFEGLTFDSSAVHQTRASYVDDVNISKSDNIAIIDSTFRSVADGTYTGAGSATIGENLGQVRESANFVFSGNTVSHYYQGLALRDSVGSVVSGNTFSHMQGDGLRLTGVQDTLVENNVFQSFFGTTQVVNHSDMIQLWSADYNKVVTDGLTIRGNVFNSTDGLGSQTMFLGNELARAGIGPNYGTIIVENNTIYNGHLHGVAIYNTDMAIVRNNTLLWDTDALMYTDSTSPGENHAPQIRLYDVADGIVTGNVASNYHAPGIDVSDNAVLNYTTTSSPNHVSHHFVNVGNGGIVDLRDLEMRPDSPWAGQYGAGAVKPGDGDGQAVAVMTQQADISDPFLIHYSAALSRDGGGATIPDDALVRWTFADGTVLEGVTVQHRLPTHGTHDVMLEVILQDGARDAISRVTRIDDPVLLRLDFDGSIGDGSSYDSAVRVSGATELVEGISGTAFRLDGSSKVIVDRSNDHLGPLDSFTLLLDLRQLPEDDRGGVFLHRHKSMTGEITQAGALKFGMHTTEGWFTVTSAAGVVTRDTWHGLQISYNGFDGGLRLLVDGTEVAHAPEISGTLLATKTHSLVVGNTWSASIKADIDNVTLLASATPITHPAGPAMDPLEEAGPSAAPMPDIIGPLAAADMLLFDFDDDQVTDLSGHATRINAGEATLVDGVQGGGLLLDGSGRSGDVQILRGADQIGPTDSLTIGVSLKQDGKAGVFLHMHKGMTAEVTANGAVKFSLETTEGWFGVTSAANVISEDTWHRMLVSFDDAADSLSLYVDGVLAAQTEASGLALARSGTYHLNMGNTWGGSMVGVLDDLAMAGVVLDADAAAHDHMAMIGQYSMLI